MKKRFVIVFVLIIACLQSCVISYESMLYFNNEEVIKINPNGSGEYLMKLDLKDAFINLKKMADTIPENAMKDLLERVNIMKVDTTIFFNNEIRQSTALSNQEKLMFNNGRIDVSVNPEENEGLVSIQLLFNDLNQLNFDRQHIWNFIGNNLEFGSNLPFISRGLYLSDHTSLNYKVIQKPSYKISSNSLISNPIGSFTTLKVSNKKVENVFNALFWEKNPDVKKLFSNLKANSLFTDQVFYKTTVVLPTEIKRYKGNGNLGIDKKTITYKNSLKDILYDPHQLEFSLEYQ